MSARALPLEAHHLRLSPVELALGDDLLLEHFLSDIVVGDDVSMRR